MEHHWYTASFAGIAITTTCDLFDITVAADKPVILGGLSISQNTDVGDAAEEVMRLGFYKGATLGSGGTSVTPAPVHDLSPAAGATMNRTVTTMSTGGTLLGLFGWNLRIDKELWLPPEFRWRISAANDPIVLRLLTAPTDSITVDATLWLAEG